MSDDFIRLIPTDVNWQPTRASADAAAAYVAALFSGPNDSVDEVGSDYYDAVTLIDAGVNTARVTCPRCGNRIDLAWVFNTIDERQHDLADLDVAVPCCGAVASLNELEYDWAMGFARFEITAMNATRAAYELNASELEQVATLLGHPVRQVLAHY